MSRQAHALRRELGPEARRLLQEITGEGEGGNRAVRITNEVHVAIIPGQQRNGDILARTQCQESGKSPEEN